jgi:cell division protein FtsI (penicillin-binding protein 3)
MAPAPRPQRRIPPRLTGAELRTRTLRRLIAFAVAMVLLVVAIVAQLVNVQVANRPRYVAYGETQRDGARDLPAGRGAIYDRNGQAFALSVALPQVVVDPSQVTDVDDTSVVLSELLDLDLDEVRAQVTADNRYQVIAKEVSDRQADAVEAAIGEGAIDGVTIEDEYVRSTPNGELAEGVIGNSLPEGQVDVEGTSGGISGLEKAYDEVLRGEPGQLYYEQDVSGNPIAGGNRQLDPARPGTDLYLTLDQSLQFEAERVLGQQVLATGADSGQAVIMRPSTGEILAMASVADDGEGEVTNTRDNRAVTAVFEPGSTNKMITIAAALEEGEVEPDTVLSVPDYLTLYDKTFTDSHPHPETMWSVTDILVTSSNIGTIKVAQTLGRERMDEYLRRFGFGTSTGLGFPAEENGIMKDPDEWSGVDIGAIPIGQGISVTSLQMLAAYNVVANGGVYVAPKLVAATDQGEGQVPTAPAEGRRVIAPETAEQMRAMLAKVVTDGTGEQAAVPGYRAAGKTGTARIPQGVGGEDGYLGTDGRYHYQASFVGLVDGADLSIIVTVEDPVTSIYGSDVAAPVFAHLAATALRRYQVPPPALAEARAVPELSDSARLDETDAPADATTAAG